MTIASCVLMADWQAIPFDECTEYSPFHHPDMVDDYLVESSRQLNKRSQCYQSAEVTSNFLESFELDSWSKLTLDSGYSVKFPLAGDIKYSCKSTDTCLCNQHPTDKKLICLQYAIRVNSEGCGILTERAQVYRGSTYSEAFVCSSPISTFSFCVVLDTVPYQSQPVQIQALNRLPSEIYPKAMNMCLEANVSSNDCYWSPQSIITGKRCEDCQPICRSISHSLTFVQFLLGSALLLVSIPVAWIPVAALISNRVPTTAQVGLPSP